MKVMAVCNRNNGVTSSMRTILLIPPHRHNLPPDVRCLLQNPQIDNTYDGIVFIV